MCVVGVFQVIEEIEEMMQESPDPEDDESPSQSDLSMLSQDLHALKRSGSNTSYEDREYRCDLVHLQAENKAFNVICALSLVRQQSHTLLPLDSYGV